MIGSHQNETHGIAVPLYKGIRHRHILTYQNKLLFFQFSTNQSFKSQKSYFLYRLYCRVKASEPSKGAGEALRFSRAMIYPGFLPPGSDEDGRQRAPG